MTVSPTARLGPHTKVLAVRPNTPGGRLRPRVIY